eukprot:TRINITY_DN1001_c0_g1::TRINITY_DN1001_c0_g1_i1::g.29905::m.29905 TRINITY_DN1001_c0_g1::TRINITY_DN1001_c0_g1_i1::g.29905  ORF type:complete len:360 (-),score=89.04,sp/Q9LY62/GT644_ARATH/36.67/2e-59,Glyco_transf_64/PF09258.5/7.2e-68 TRINITY_DN1001_c0_g1_i1:346-1425(-)
MARRKVAERYIAVPGEDPEEATSDVESYTEKLPEKKKSWISKLKSWLPYILFAFSMTHILILLISMRRSSGRQYDLAYSDITPMCNSGDRNFTVILNTFRRNDLLVQSAPHYSQCPCVDSVRVIWSDLKYAPSEFPEVMDMVESSREAGRAPIEIMQQDTDSLNNRLRPIADLRTRGVFSIDDDNIVSCEDLLFGLSVWWNSPDTIVGFVPRMHGVNEDGLLEYKLFYPQVWESGMYSMVFPKAAFFHNKYLHGYTYDLPRQIWDYVHEHINCEDIALNFLVSNATGLPPIWVRPKPQELGGSWVGGTPGISSDQDHIIKRTECLRFFQEVYGYLPLKTNQLVATRVSEWWLWELLVHF